MKKNKRYLLLFIFLMLLITYYEYITIGESLVSTGLFESEKRLQKVICSWGILLLSAFSFWGLSKIYLKKSISRWISWFFFFAFISSLINALVNGLPSISSPIIWISPLFVFWGIYIISIKLDNTNLMFFTFLLSTYVLIYGYFESYRETMFLTLREDVALISSYYSLYMLPLVMTGKNKKILIYITIAVMVVVVITAIKRTGAIALALGLLSYFYIYTSCAQSLKGNTLKKMAAFTCMVALVAALVGYISLYADTLLFDRLTVENIRETEGSNRIEVWTRTWKMIMEEDYFGYILGNGFSGVGKVAYSGAHNDFLEVFYDYGIFGLILYVLMHVKLIQYVFMMIKRKSRYAAPMGMSYAIFFVVSNTSQIVIYPYFEILFVIVWGYLIASDHKETIYRKQSIYGEKNNSNSSTSILSVQRK